MKQLISLPHHSHDYECMWNGIEDLYMAETGQSLPADFFFLLSGFGSFCYRKTEKSDLKRMVALGDGRTRKMYEFLAPIVGFTYHHRSCAAFERALKIAKEEINTGHPVVLGALDMYELPYYPKLYRKEHIPFHYVLMTGYDDEQSLIYLYDCGRTELLSLDYDGLKAAMNCSYPGLSSPNTVCTVRMNTRKDKYQIASEALAVQRERFLNPPASFLGCRGFEKMIRELPGWKKELSKEEYDKIMLNMVTFFGTVPSVPNAIKGVDAPDEITYCGGFDKMARMLTTIGSEKQEERWLNAAAAFHNGAGLIGQISTVITEYLCGKDDQTQQLPPLFAAVLKQMERGYSVL